MGKRTRGEGEEKDQGVLVRSNGRKRSSDQRSPAMAAADVLAT